MALSMRKIATLPRCLNIKGEVSTRRDILSIRDLPPPWSLRDELNFINRTRCRPLNPSSLRVTDMTASKISISWKDRSDNEDGFKIRFRGKRAGSGDHTGSKTVGSNRVSATLTDLQSNTEYTISVVAFNTVGESTSTNEVQATTPLVPETVTVSLQRQQILEGPIPYLGQYPPKIGFVHAGHLLKIALPQSTVVLGIRFLKPGHSNQDCNDPGAVVVVREGQTASPEQMIAIFGVPKPEYSSTWPIFFMACLLTSQNAPVFDSWDIELTIISDVE